MSWRIHVISPFHEHAGNETMLRAQAMGRDELLVILPPSDRLVRDLLMYKRTEKYVRQNSSHRAAGDRQAHPQRQGACSNQERHGRCAKLVEELLAEAKLVVNGQDVEISSERRQARGSRWASTSCWCAPIPTCACCAASPTRRGDIGALPAGQRRLCWATTRPPSARPSRSCWPSCRATSATACARPCSPWSNTFERKPYGWYLAAIQCTAAKLCGRGKVEFTRDSNILEGDDLERALGNTHGYTNLILEPQIDFTAAQVRRLKEFYADFFDGPPLASEAKALGQETAAAFRTLAQSLEQLLGQAGRYPVPGGADASRCSACDALAGKPYTFYLTELRQQEDELLDLKEGVIDPLRRFMSGPQAAILRRRAALPGQTRSPTCPTWTASRRRRCG